MCIRDRDSIIQKLLENRIIREKVKEYVTNDTFGKLVFLLLFLSLIHIFDADVGCGTEVGDLGIERSEFRKLDEVAETLFLHHLVGDGELVID